MEPYLYIILATVATIVICSIFYKLYNHFTQVWTIWEFQTGLLYRHGKFVKCLNAGKHRLWGAGHCVIAYDNRNSELVVQGQEVITSDCATLKITAVAQWRIVEAVKFHSSADDSRQALYTVIQLALRKVVGGISLDDIIEKKSSFGAVMCEVAKVGIDDLGIEIVSVDIRDVMLSAELKNSYQGVLMAKKESLSNLEKARGEAAALRTQANAARLFEKNPDLMRMKYLETLKEAGTGGYGNTLVIGVPEELASFANKTI
jgi:regulator of protease activity HflC (stomatin/prohibitin superfamily)